MIYFCPINNERSEVFNPNDYLCAEVTDKTIIDTWKEVSIPSPPKLKSVAIDAKTSALLVLDMENSICRSSRCIASIPIIHDLLAKARKNAMLVIYSLTLSGNSRDISRQLSPYLGEPVVKSSVDKFYKTNLEEILQAKVIKTVIVTGYAANGAVLHTATSAAFRGFNVIVPVDCMSADNPYAEQYTAWHMLNSPGTRDHALLTKEDLISFTH